MSVTPTNRFDSTESMLHTLDSDVHPKKDIQQEKANGDVVGVHSSYVLHLPRFFSKDASFLDCVIDCCEIAYRALTSLITAPLYFLYLAFKGGGTMFDFRANNITPKRLEEMGKKYNCTDNEATFLIYVDETMNAAYRVMMREGMSSSTFKGVFQFGDSKETYVPGVSNQREKILCRALEYYRSQSTYNPLYLLSSIPRTFTVQYAGYTSPSFGFIRSIYGKFGCVSIYSQTSLAFEDEADIFPQYSYHLRTSDARKTVDTLDRLPTPTLIQKIDGQKVIKLLNVK